MEYIVQGKLENIGPLKNELIGLGYKVDSNLFLKSGKIESIINELVPHLEQRGINVFDELYLEEYNTHGTMQSVYNKGKITRLEID
ncbi:hypothetical protein SAMN00017405_1178 [Desulfonispora thiosulfatigenes DSM 11270]|uniref:Uncharacterized protein n=1 Tax=Desulfonispora thiosulfatigenes DSM 11270 TaxID=656914 RepID=A0A1W1V030_DESTI|nr:hypothetical protein [Desulfonispora thiosulfatigenes]SMB86707.1 hypothetical protein SAMN00017405_1178 [Desulfonispora thiosulfatigenes DSM 11270]